VGGKVLVTWYVELPAYYPQILGNILGSLVKLRKRLLAISLLSLRMEQFGSHWTDCHEISHLRIFPHYVKNRTILVMKIIEHKIFLFSLQLSSETSLVPRRTE
jgi:hypothetical protein